MGTSRLTEIKRHLCLALCCLCVGFAVFCNAADVTSVPVDCKAARVSAAKPEQRIEIAAHGFSVLPPQGERWCYTLLASSGVSFFKVPKLDWPHERPPSLEEFVAGRLFSATAVSLKGLRGFDAPIEHPDDLKTLVVRLIRQQFFAQFTTGLISGEHRFRLLESNLTSETYAGAMCVKFDARVEEQGNLQAPNLVFLLNFPGNVVCRHPGVSETELIWIGFVERYLQGEQSTADALKLEYEPYVQSVQFMPPHHTK
jgi:hypothetical protein